MSLLLKNCGQVVISSDGKPKIGKDLSVVETVENVDVLIRDGKFVQVAPGLSASDDVKVIDCQGKTVIPGFVDAHTHPVFDGDRANEFAMKLAGAGYMQIHAAGGGIHYTVKATKEASEDVLYEKLLKRLDNMIDHGTLVMEAKSGYGLDVETEIKMLRVIKRAKDSHRMKIQSTYLCAHAVPIGADAAQMTNEISTEHIAKVAAADLDVENIDIFCEAGVYDASQTEQMLRAGMEHGWNINFHAEEIEYIGGTEMGCRLGARAISHLEKVSDEAIRMMAEVRNQKCV